MKHTVLVIEDNEQNLYLVRFLLEKHGFSVQEARDGRLGVSLASELRPDLILLDIQLPMLDGYAVALAVARANAARHQVADRLQFLAGDGFAALPPAATFDLIISNPPYIPTAEIPTLDPEVRDFDPASALDGGPDGLKFYEILARTAARHLRPGGKIMLEFGDGQAPAIQHLFEAEHWHIDAIQNDYTQRPRILFASPSL